VQSSGMQIGMDHSTTWHGMAWYGMACSQAVNTCMACYDGMQRQASTAHLVTRLPH